MPRPQRKFEVPPSGFVNPFRIRGAEFEPPIVFLHGRQADLRDCWP